MDPHNPLLDHPTPEQRTALGKQVRKAVPRASHAAWSPPAGRDPVGILQAQDATRVSELVPIRWGRMLASPFTFYRGGAALMAADLATTPSSGFQVQACGDAHISNFGGFAAPDRSLVFDLNDFDETLPGPWEWDVKRMAASVEIAGRDRNESVEARRSAVVRSVRAYREAMREFAADTNLNVWYSRLDVADLGRLADATNAPLSKTQRKNFAAALKKAEGKSSLRALSKLTEEVDGQRRFRSMPPLLVPLDELFDGPDPKEGVQKTLQNLMGGYDGIARDRRQLFDTYKLVDMARKVVGVGSVGTRAWVMLMLGRDGSDPLVLQAKEAQASVLEAHVAPSQYEQHGERVVEGQRLMQATGDIFLGWRRILAPDGVTRDFYVRQLWDGKMSADLAAMQADPFKVYVDACGWTLARAHARTGDRIAIAAYLGGGKEFDEAIADFAVAYADQNDLDYALAQTAVAEHRILAEAGI